MKTYSNLDDALMDMSYSTNIIRRNGPNEAVFHESFEQDGDTECLDARVKYMAGGAKYHSHLMSNQQIKNYYQNQALQLNPSEASQSNAKDPSNDPSYYNSQPDTAMTYDPGNEAPTMTLTDLSTNVPTNINNGAEYLVSAINQAATGVPTPVTPASMVKSVCYRSSEFGDASEVVSSITSVLPASISTDANQAVQSIATAATGAQALATQVQNSAVTGNIVAQAPNIIASLQAAPISTALMFSGLAWFLIPKFIPGAKYLPLAIMGAWAYGQASPAAAATSSATPAAPAPATVPTGQS